MWLPLVQAFQNPEQLQEDRVHEFREQIMRMSAQLKLPDAVFIALWEREMTVAFQKKAWAEWSHLAVVGRPAWPEPFPQECIQSHAETVIVATLIEMLRLEGRTEDVKELFKVLTPLLADFQPHGKLKTDLIDLSKVVLVHDAAAEQIDNVRAIKNRMIDRKADPPSKFAKVPSSARHSRSIHPAW